MCACTAGITDALTPSPKIPTNQQQDRVFTVYGEGWDTVGELKAKIEAQSGLLAHQQRLIFRQKLLRDPWRLGGQGIVPHAVVHLMLDLWGGGILVRYRHDSCVPCPLRVPPPKKRIVGSRLSNQSTLHQPLTEPGGGRQQGEREPVPQAPQP